MVNNFSYSFRTGRIIYISLLLFWSTFLFSQEGTKISNFCKKFNYQEIENGLNKFQEKSNTKTKYHWLTVLERELINDFTEQIIEFTKAVKDEKNSAIQTIYIHKIKLIKKSKEEIVYYEVIYLKNIKLNGEWVPTEIVLKKDSNNALEQLKSEFQKTYNTSLCFDELFETDIVFGQRCGFSAIDPKYRVKMNKLVESKDTTTLIRWLRSATVEVQLYAIDGIFALKKKGISFNKTVFDLIDLIEMKEGKAYTCSGCTHWNEPIKEVVEGIKEKHFK